MAEQVCQQRRSGWIALPPKKKRKMERKMRKMGSDPVFPDGPRFSGCNLSERLQMSAGPCHEIVSVQLAELPRKESLDYEPRPLA
jgi:hypothetical protein